MLPTNGITGIVEFLEPSEARIAFKRLAYSKFKYLPLYLEWAPDDSLSANATKTKKRNRKQLKSLMKMLNKKKAIGG
uniref:Rna-binding protein 19 n=1 Tax=Triatoma infestans TaxID=30076 RepID=A0A161MZX5_TRIIF